MATPDGRWWGHGPCPRPGGDWGTHRPTKCPPHNFQKTHSGTPSSVQGCAKPRWGKLPMQTSQAVPLCTHLSRVPWKYLSGHSHPLLHFLSGSCTRSPLGFSCYLNSAKGTELPVWELLPRQRGRKESIRNALWAWGWVDGGTGETATRSPWRQALNPSQA